MFGDPPKELPQHFAVVMAPEFTMMPVTSAIEPLRIANRLSEKTLYKWTMHSVDGQPVAASNDIPVSVSGRLTDIGRPDMAVISASYEPEKGLTRPMIATVITTSISENPPRRRGVRLAGLTSQLTVRWSDRAATAAAR